MDLTPTPSFRLDGKRALVTGGGGGIGFAASCALSQAGAHVTVADIVKEGAERTVAALREHGRSAEVLVLDVTNVEAVRAAVGAAEPFDILINNAGTNRPAPMVDVKVEDFDHVMGLNVRAAFFVAQAVARRLLAAKRGGSIINISSTMGHVGMPTRAVYSASKHAVEGFTKVMGIELAPHNIRVNAIAPTFVETPMSKKFFENRAFFEEVTAKIKFGRLGRLEELAGAIVFLASDASSLMTGTSMLLDGGWTAD